MKIYTRNFNGVFDDILNHVDSVSIEEADKVLAWQDVLPDWVNTVNYAHELGKEVILMTHCFASCNDYLPPHNHTPLADKILVWGQADYNMAIQAGLAHKTIITGTPIFNHIKPKVKHEGTNIVYCPARLETVDENYEIAEKLRGYDAKILTKVIDGQKLTKYDNPVYSDRSKTDHIDISFNMIAEADIVVVNDPTTTFALFAFACDVPVVCVNNISKKYYLIKHYLGSGEYQTSIDKLYETLDEVLQNDTKQEQRRLWAEYCGAFIKNPLENILKEINT